MLENFNMNFQEKLVIHSSKEQWLESPSKKVLRIPLEREGKESGHTTSIVEYLPGAYFPEHQHPLGEEIFVLEGVFSDEHGDYPTGTWLRSPHMSIHHPWVEEETIILVKTGHLLP